MRGRPVRYGVAGTGEPVVLVHGLSGSARWWSRNVPALTPRFRVFLIDLPGFGRMRGLRREFALSEASRWLLEWMAAVDLERVHLVGHSMGGYISIRLAALRPDAVDRLVLVAPAGVPTGRSIFGHLVPLLLAARRSSLGFFPTLAYDAARMGPLTLLRAASDLLAEDVREDLHRIEAPTLLLWGANDPLVPPSASVLMREEIPDSHVLMLRGAGHVPMFDRPQEFDAALVDFLAGKPVGE